uniref:Uncharacterized protein n=1 Tax=Lepeophtheirus salmonis TaxID=72036 RepID=A0A0K2UWP9_LEPSM
MNKSGSDIEYLHPHFILINHQCGINTALSMPWQLKIKSTSSIYPSFLTRTPA